MGVHSKKEERGFACFVFFPSFCSQGRIGAICATTNVSTNGVFSIKMVDLKTRQIIFEQDIYFGFNYQELAVMLCVCVELFLVVGSFFTCSHFSIALKWKIASLVSLLQMKVCCKNSFCHIKT
jgi:hypothetical protein